MYIRVECNKLDSTAAVIEAYLGKFRKQMKQADGAVETMKINWQGDDSQVFVKQWETVTDSSSTTKGMEKALEAYGEYMRYAASQYKKAQDSAISRGSQLTK